MSTALPGRKVQRPVVFESLERRDLFAVLVPGYSETQFAGGNESLRWVTGMDFVSDGRLLIASQYDSRLGGGALRVVKNGQLLAKPALILPVSRGYERGLLGVLADQSFAYNRYIYVYWTANSTPAKNYTHNVISRFTMVGDLVDPASRLDLFEQGPVSSEYHNGGSMHWGPDGKLYVGVGDNAYAPNSQSLATTKGKLLRLNKDGSIPADNPFYNSTTGINRSIYALGLRNPFTFAFQPGGSRLFINDVGLNTWEEVDEGAAGANYGWPLIDGPRTTQTPPAKYKDPIFAYRHPTDTGLAAITGAAFWKGAYYYGDYVSGKISQLNLTNFTSTPFAQSSSPVDFDVGPDGALYILANGPDAKVFRIDSTATAKPGITTQPQNVNVAAGNAATFTVTAFGNNLKYQWQRNGLNIANAVGSSYTLPAASLADNGATFRVIVSNSAGTVTSAAARLTVLQDNRPVVNLATPAAGFKWTAGKTLAFAGSAVDAEDGNLPASALTWSIDYFTGAAQRPLLPTETGIFNGTVLIPDSTPYTKADVFLRVTLSAKDSQGLTSTVVRDLSPNKITLTVKTNVAGLAFALDGTEYRQAQSALAVVGVKRTIGVPATQTLNGITYKFTGWSDGGALQHEIATPATNTTYTANFTRVVAAATRFNFQPATSTAVSGYYIDVGNTFNFRNGRQYGWTTSHTTRVSDHNINASQLLDTDVSVIAASKWQLAVPNGRYTVKVSAGSAKVATTANVWVEGVSTISWASLGANKFLARTITVDVKDGLLTVGIGSAATGTVSLNYIEISPASL